MQLVTTIAEYKAWRRSLSGSVGLVSTMGYLHEGHLSLVHQAKAENDFVVVTIFVNPSQFAPTEDLARYPRDMERDLSILEKERADIVFAPSAEEMYPTSFCTWVNVERITQRLEGAARPSFFRGVATVVTKLVNITQPHRAYFGEKDAQQLLLIKRMAQDLNMNLEVIGLPMVREADGLAMSSRNSYLNPRERQSALVLYKALELARQLYSQGERDAEKVCQAIRHLIAQEPQASIDYVSIAHVESLEELEVLSPPALVSLAVKIGSTRLIDNITIS